MTAWREIEQEVAERAQGRCKYCRMHQALQGATFHVEHIIPRCRNGPSDPENLAWACPGCNLHKSDRVEVQFAEAGEIVPLFNPRRDRWSEHFAREGYFIRGLTPVGEATVETLRLNHERRIRIRQAEELFGLFPPDDLAE